MVNEQNNVTALLFIPRMISTPRSPRQKVVIFMQSVQAEHKQHRLPPLLACLWTFSLPVDQDDD